ncbi:MAG: hypothetical protein U0802_05070 [Candidatus Binatia bacterium]
MTRLNDVECWAPSCGGKGRGYVVAAAVVLLLAGPARAAQVYWDAPESLGAGQTGALDLVFEDGASRPAR